MNITAGVNLKKSNARDASALSVKFRTSAESSFESVINSKMRNAAGRDTASALNAIFKALFFIPRFINARQTITRRTRVFTVDVRFPDAEKSEYRYFSPEEIAGESKLKTSKTADRAKKANIGALFLNKSEIYTAIAATR